MTNRSASSDSRPRTRRRSTRERSGRKVLRSFTATPKELDMLTDIAAYHGFSRSGTITNLIKKEFWRVFPRGSQKVKPDPGARVLERGHES